MEKYGFVYIWYDRKHKMYYIGRHWGSEDDGYICSQNRMRNSYKRRPFDFKRKILNKVISKIDLIAEEQRWLNFIKKEELGIKYYNKNLKSDTPSMLGIKHSEESKQKIRDNHICRKEGYVHHSKGISQNKEWIEKRIKANTGKKRTDETKIKMSIAKKGKICSAEHVEKLRQIGKSRRWYNNGTENRFCPSQPEGFVPGRFKKEVVCHF